jgi:hypothetical protein
MTGASSRALRAAAIEVIRAAVAVKRTRTMKRALP